MDPAMNEKVMALPSWSLWGMYSVTRRLLWNPVWQQAGDLPIRMRMRRWKSRQQQGRDMGQKPTKREKSGRLWVVNRNKSWGRRCWGLRLGWKSWGYAGLAPLCGGIREERDINLDTRGLWRGDRGHEKHIFDVFNPHHDLSSDVIRPL